MREPEDGGAAPDPVHAEVDDEVRFHLERKVEKLVRSGMGEEEARAEALRRFGDVERIKTEMSQMTRKRESKRRRTETLDLLRQDALYALRQLARSPGFAAVTALTLTLGIGATTAIFSVVDGIVFRPLPFEEPEELVAVWSDYTARGGPVDEWPNFPNLWGLGEQSRTLEAVGIWNGASGTLTGLDGPAEAIAGASVSYDMFARVLRAEPALGRSFSPDDDHPGAPATILLAHDFWVRAFGADPGVVGRTLQINGVSYEVVGVMREDFRPTFVPDADYWTPLRMDMSDHACGRGGACLRSVARLADGVSLEAAQAEAAEIGARQAAADPEANTGVTWSVVPLQADLVGNAHGALLLVLGAAGLVLLMACVNQASLLLARGTGRRGELAIRSAMGAGQARIVAQLLVESVVLALLGGALGVGLAYLLTDVLVAIAPPGTPRLGEVAVDGRVLAFAAGVSALSGLLFGLLPALQSARGAPQQALRESGRGDSRAGGVRIRQALVAAQVALALVLLAGSGVLVKSFRNLREVDMGFRPEGVLTFRVTAPPARYETGDAALAFHEELGSRLAALPGVEAAAATTSLPLGGFNTDTGFTIEGRPAPGPGESQAVWYQSVTPGLLEAIGTDVVTGRAFRESDQADGGRVVVVNETFASRYFPGEDALGRRLDFGDPAEPEWWQIVGVAKDVRHFAVRGAPRPSLYFPAAETRPRAMFHVVRSERDPESLATDVRATLAALDPELAAALVAPLDELVSDSLAPDRFVTMLLSLFATVALVLAAVGLYGVVSYNVNTRVREMGVRLALGATGGAVVRLVVARSLLVVAIGMGVGLAGSVGLTRWMEGLAALEDILFGVGATDLSALLAAVVVLGGTAVLASFLPARRAAGVHPSQVLREE